MTRRKRIAQALVIAVLALAVVSACGDAGDETGGSQPQGLDLNVTLGTKNFDEQFLLGQLYKQALACPRLQGHAEARTSAATEVIDASLQRGEIDGYPEYLGVAATVLAREDVVGKNAQQTYGIARDFYASRGQALSQQTRFENVDAIATTRVLRPAPRPRNRSPTFASCPTSPSAPDRSSRTASRACRACSRPTG